MSELKAGIILCVGVVVLAVGIALLRASQEARVYTRLTGQQVTTWEALWVQLRVDCQ